MTLSLGFLEGSIDGIVVIAGGGRAVIYCPHDTKVRPGTRDLKRTLQMLPSSLRHGASSSAWLRVRHEPRTSRRIDRVNSWPSGHWLARGPATFSTETWCSRRKRRIS